MRLSFSSDSNLRLSFQAGASVFFGHISSLLYVFDQSHI